MFMSVLGFASAVGFEVDEAKIDKSRDYYERMMKGLADDSRMHADFGLHMIKLDLGDAKHFDQVGAHATQQRFDWQCNAGRTQVDPTRPMCRWSTTWM